MFDHHHSFGIFKVGPLEQLTHLRWDTINAATQGDWCLPRAMEVTLDDLHIVRETMIWPICVFGNFDVMQSDLLFVPCGLLFIVYGTFFSVYLEVFRISVWVCLDQLVRLSIGQKTLPSLCLPQLFALSYK